MSENYVDDREFRSEIRRIEQKVDNAVERIELKMDVYTARMDGRIGKLEARVDGIGNFIGWTIGIAAIIITIGTFVFQIIAK